MPHRRSREPGGNLPSQLSRSASFPRLKLARGNPAEGVSVSVGAHHLTQGATPQCPPGLQIDRVLHEFHRAIGEADVDAARVIAGRWGRALRIDKINPGAAAERPLEIVTGWTVRSAGVEIAVN